jgi:hypothetical protein
VAVVGMHTIVVLIMQHIVMVKMVVQVAVELELNVPVMVRVVEVVLEV